MKKTPHSPTTSYATRRGSRLPPSSLLCYTFLILYLQVFTGSQHSIITVCPVETLPNYSVPVQQFRSFIFALRQSSSAARASKDLAAQKVLMRSIVTCDQSHKAHATYLIHTTVDPSSVLSHRRTTSHLSRFLPFTKRFCFTTR